MQIKRHDPFCDRSGRAVLVGFERGGHHSPGHVTTWEGMTLPRLDGNVHHLSIDMTSSFDK